jgi:hypothetical protein
MDAPRYVVVKRQPAYVQRQAKVFVVNNADIDDASRYIPVDRYSNGTRYVAVRSGYRKGNGIVAYVDRDDDSPRYVAVRRTPVYTQTRYVAVRNDDDLIRPARYVAVRKVRNSCTCSDELNSSLDQVETRTPGHVVVKSDYIDGTEDVVYRGEVVNDNYAISNVDRDDDDLYPVSPAVSASYVVSDDDTEIPAQVAVVPASNVVYDDTSEMPAEFVPAVYDDNDFDDEAIVDTDNVTYVADNDIDDACLSTVAVQAPMEYRVGTVSYVPVEDIDDDDTSDVSMLYGWNDGSDSSIASVPVVDSEDIDTGITYVVADDMGSSCSCPIADSDIDDDVDVDTVSYVPASYVDDMDSDSDEVTFVPVEDVDTDATSYTPVEDVYTTESSGMVPVDEMDIGTTDFAPVENIETESYIPDSAMDADNLSYVPDDMVDHVDDAGMPADDMSMAVAEVGTSVTDDIDSSNLTVDETGDVMLADMASTQAVAGENGFNDGLADGRNAAMNLDQNLPGNTLNFQTATNGSADTMGDTQIYQDAYRSSYLQGFSEGYNSVIGSS